MIVSISDFNNLCSKCKIRRDSCIQLDFCNYTRNENLWELFWGFFATSGTQNLNSFFLHKILVLNSNTAYIEKINLPAVLYGREILGCHIKVRRCEMLGYWDIVWN